ncbi:MAG: FadR/GntR family transcriptional regulator [Bacillota bacterium]|nr:FadR/GntR family transcriptional regulator [Bacillota bacterium]
MQEKKSLSELTADTLRNLILEKKEYKMGEKLPNENVLSTQLGISRATLREAIRSLVSEGVLEVRRGSGTFVANQLNKPAYSAVNMAPSTELKVTLKDLYEVRMIFEPEAAALACKRATDEEIEEILRLGEECQKQILINPGGPDRIASEAAFHGAIIKASHNEFLYHFMPILNETIEKTLDIQTNLDMIADVAYKDHFMIMDFLKKRDALALKSTMVIHLHHAILIEQISLEM